MKARKVFRLMLSVVLLLLTGRSSLARGQGPTGPPEAAGVNARPVANAPWFKIAVDTAGNTGQYASVAIDRPTGFTYISYYDATEKELRMATYVGSGGNCGPDNDWSCETVDSAGDVGKYSSIAIDQENRNVGIAYYDATNGNLKHAYRCMFSICMWVIQTIDKGIFPVSSTGLYTSLKYSGSYPRIAYYFCNPTNVDALMVAYYVSSGGNCGYGNAAGKWQCDTIQTGEGVGQHASLALNKFGFSNIAYYDGGNGDLWYATNFSGTNCGPGNSWTCYPVSAANDVGQYASLYVDNGYHFHTAYYDATTDMLEYAVDLGSGGNCGLFGSAQCDEIDAMQTGYHPLGVSIAEDAAGYPIIAYQSKLGFLRVARPAAALGLSGGGGNCGPANPFFTWKCESIDRYGRFIPYRQADYVSIDVNSAGLATIAYYGNIGSSGGDLKVAYQRPLQVFLPLVMKRQ